MEVWQLLNGLNTKDKEIIKLFYLYNFSQEQISTMLNIPVGTVKSRLFTAKKNFKNTYFAETNNIFTGADIMSKMPLIMPEYTIVRSDKEPFDVKWEELMGWFIVPKSDEKISWAMYDFLSKKRTEYVDMEVTGKAVVHGILGVEISVKEYKPMYFNKAADKYSERTFVAELIDTHCRFLAESHVCEGIKKLYTFLDGDEFLHNWGFGDDNCGKKTDLKIQNIIIRENDVITYSENTALDIVDRYNVKIGSKIYDTICVMDIEQYNGGVVSEQYIDKNGRTILWRRFNKNDWKFDFYNILWSEKLPKNQTITVNGEVYVHWYDCITDYIL